MDRVRALALSLTDAQIAATLDADGLRSAKGKAFAVSRVKWIRFRHNIPVPSLKQPAELTVGPIADRFRIRPGAVYYCIERGHLAACRLGPGHTTGLNPKSEIGKGSPCERG